MVKKIRVLDEPVAAPPMDASPEALYELQKTMDWKLWEIYNMMKDNIPESTDTDKK